MTRAPPNDPFCPPVLSPPGMTRFVPPFISLDAEGKQAVFDEVLLKNGFQLDYTRTHREDFVDNTVYEVSDGRRSALVCLAWHENIQDSTIKKLRDQSETGERPFFICLERGLTTTAPPPSGTSSTS